MDEDPSKPVQRGKERLALEKLLFSVSLGAQLNLILWILAMPLAYGDDLTVVNYFVIAGIIFAFILWYYVRKLRRRFLAMPV